MSTATSRTAMPPTHWNGKTFLWFQHQYWQRMQKVSATWNTASSSSCSPTGTSYLSNLPSVQLYIIKALSSWNTAGVTSAGCLTLTIPAFLTCLWFLHFLRSNPKPWISQHLGFSLIEFEKKPTESYNELHHDYNKEQCSSTLSLWEKRFCLWVQYRVTIITECLAARVESHFQINFSI